MKGQRNRDENEKDGGALMTKKQVVNEKKSNEKTK